MGLRWSKRVPNRPMRGSSACGWDFRDNLPRRMELVDAFGNTTLLTFDRFERNPALDPALFAFTPPPGADVVGE